MNQRINDRGHGQIVGTRLSMRNWTFASRLETTQNEELVNDIEDLTSLFLHFTFKQGSNMIIDMLKEYAEKSPVHFRTLRNLVEKEPKKHPGLTLFVMERLGR